MAFLFILGVYAKRTKMDFCFFYRKKRTFTKLFRVVKTKVEQNNLY